MLPELQTEHPLTIACFNMIQAQIRCMTRLPTSQWSEAALKKKSPAGEYPFPYQCMRAVTDPLQWQEMNRLALIVVNLSGPTELLDWLIVTFSVNCNFRGPDGASLLMLAVAQGDIANTARLLQGSGLNKADPTLRSLLKGVTGPTTALHTAALLRDDKPATKKYPGSPPFLCRHPRTGELMSRALYLVELLLAHGASHSIVWQPPNSEPERKPWQTASGCTVLTAAARSGSVDIFRAIVKHAADAGDPVDLNDTSFVTRKERSFAEADDLCTDITPFSCIGGCSRTAPCCYGVACTRLTCNAPLALEMLTLGANPHIRARDRAGNGYPTRFCASAAGDVGMHMLRIVLDWKYTIALCMNGRSKGVVKRALPEEVVAAIIKFAGVGEAGVADEAFPKIPSLPLRDSACYTQIDAFWKRRALIKQALIDKVDYVAVGDDMVALAPLRAAAERAYPPLRAAARA